jgi:HD-GYP domain-containing protein (c-di-GMP phosphodiesterase class II)
MACSFHLQTLIFCDESADETPVAESVMQTKRQAAGIVSKAAGLIINQNGPPNGGIGVSTLKGTMIGLERFVGGRNVFGGEVLSNPRERELREQTIDALSAALDVHDDDAAGHAQRVTLYALEMARRMGCSQAEIDNLERAARVHDIGKIGIPDAILLKPGRLTEEETEVMKAHVQIGYQIVSRLGFMAASAEIVLTHHERWDGDGYPQGLRGDEIPLGTRIFTVADTLDAITSDRPYRRAAPYAVARAEIERESGHQFDPRVVQTFLSVPEEVWEEIRQQLAETRPHTQRDMPRLIMVWHRLRAR